MGIATELSYSFPRPSGLRKAVRVVASSGPGAWTLARVVPSLDRAAARLSGGRATFSEQLAGLPVIVVTTTGRRSGKPRPAQLIGIPVGDTLGLLGTNFGQAATPTWVLNLEADPRATVSHRDVTLDVVARAATEAEEVEILSRAGEVYVGYPKYFTRVSGRRVRFFVLEEPPDGTPS